MAKTRTRKAQPSMIGGDREADYIMDQLPRDPKQAVTAFVYIDASGRLRIALDTLGSLFINENNLCYVHGDELA